MKNYSFVFQNVYLFHDTIANNIRFGQPDAPMEKVIAAAKKACCHDFISALPDGYETVIGEGGASLSGGERQRIAIARALMNHPDLVLADEPSGNLDEANSAKLNELFGELNEKFRQAFLIVTHDENLASFAKRRVVMHNGLIQDFE